MNAERGPAFTVDGALGGAVAAWAALSQDVPLAVIQRGVAEGRLVMADQRTPEWFAAAASQDAPLSDIAPELGMVSEQGLNPGVDLVRIYSSSATHDSEPSNAGTAASESVDVERLALLRALADLDE